MDLKLDAGQLARFLDLRPKVIVAAGDSLAEVCLDVADMPLFDKWVFTAEGTIHPWGAAQAGGKLIAVPNPPAATCVLAAQSEEGCAVLGILRTWWSANGPHVAPAMLRCRDRETAAVAILRVLLQATQQELQETAAHATAATSQIYALRCEFDQTRVVVESLQQQVIRLQQRPQLLTYHLPPTGTVYVPSGDGETLIQTLPVSAEGLAGIDLHFPAGGPVADGSQVLVRLHALDMGCDLGAWRLLPQHLGRGWVRCWLAEVLGTASHDLEVRVQWHGRNGDAVPAISLASAADWDERCARGPTGLVDGCLALTAWGGGIPGTPLKGAALPCVPGADGSVEYCLSTEEINRMVLHIPPVAWKPDDWYPFQARADGSFMLHPIGTRATTVKLTDGCLPGCERVTAVVKITSPKPCSDVEYAIAASRNNEANVLLDSPDPASDPRFLAFSGWRRIPRDDAAQVIVVDFAEPLMEAAHLILATRVPPGMDHNWAWADWLDVRLRVRGLPIAALDTTETIREKRAA